MSRYLYKWSKSKDRADPTIYIKRNDRRVKIIITLYVKHENEIKDKPHTRMYITYYRSQRGRQTLLQHQNIIMTTTVKHP